MEDGVRQSLLSDTGDVETTKSLIGNLAWTNGGVLRTAGRRRTPAVCVCVCVCVYTRLSQLSSPSDDHKLCHLTHRPSLFFPSCFLFSPPVSLSLCSPCFNFFLSRHSIFSFFVFSALSFCRCRITKGERSSVEEPGPRGPTRASGSMHWCFSLMDYWGEFLVVVSFVSPVSIQDSNVYVYM